MNSKHQPAITSTHQRLFSLNTISKAVYLRKFEKNPHSNEIMNKAVKMSGENCSHFTTSLNAVKAVPSWEGK